MLLKKSGMRLKELSLIILIWTKKLAEKIINDISYGNEHTQKMFDNEFKVLTDTVNSYRIRHHEINKIDINMALHYKYFYKRYLALISVIIENLK